MDCIALQDVLAHQLRGADQTDYIASRCSSRIVMEDFNSPFVSMHLPGIWYASASGNNGVGLSVTVFHSQFPEFQIADAA